MKKYCSEVYIENFSGSIAGIERPAPMKTQNMNDVHEDTFNKSNNEETYQGYTRKELIAKLHRAGHKISHSAEHGALHSLFHQLVHRH